MAALPALITVEQFQQMKDDGRAYELHYGEVVCVTRPKFKHHVLQDLLVDRLKAMIGVFGHVTMELAYRAMPEFDLRVAHVAVVSQGRWDAADPEGYLHGAPELVIEIKSPPGVDQELRELVPLCLNSGALEFWIVQPDQHSIIVVHRDGTATLYAPGDNIPLSLFQGDSLSVDAIFGAVE